jgi:hypothetical protein
VNISFSGWDSARLRELAGRELVLPSWEHAMAENWLGKWAMNLPSSPCQINNVELSGPKLLSALPFEEVNARLQAFKACVQQGARHPSPPAETAEDPWGALAERRANDGRPLRRHFKAVTPKPPGFFHVLTP